MFDISIWEEKILREKEERELKRKNLLKEIIPKLRDYFGDKEVKKFIYLAPYLWRIIFTIHLMWI